jgi:hypothetical protein
LGNIWVTFDVFYPLKNCLISLLFESISNPRIFTITASIAVRGITLAADK